MLVRLLVLGFAGVLLSVASASGQSSPPAAPKAVACGGTPAQQRACLEAEHEKARVATFTKARAFASLAMTACTPDAYAAWQENLDRLVAVWSAANAAFAATNEPLFSEFAWSVELHILESRFAVADAALHNGGRSCRSYAEQQYRIILQGFVDPAFWLARERAQIGLDAVRALPKLD